MKSNKKCPTSYMHGRSKRLGWLGLARRLINVHMCTLNTRVHEVVRIRTFESCLCAHNSRIPVVETSYQISLQMGWMTELQVEKFVCVWLLEYIDIQADIFSSPEYSVKGVECPSFFLLHGELDGQPDPVEMTMEFFFLRLKVVINIPFSQPGSGWWCLQCQAPLKLHIEVGHHSRAWGAHHCTFLLLIKFPPQLR